MNDREKQIYINEGLRYFQPLQRRQINQIPVETNQSIAHFFKICNVCFSLALNSNTFIVNAKLKNGNRPDITVLYPERWHIEIVDSEKAESIEEKRKKYPFDVQVINAYDEA